MKTTIFCLSLFFFLSLLTINAQTRTISGKVTHYYTSSDYMEGAIVELWDYIGSGGTLLQTATTDIYGDFEFSVAPTSYLEIKVRDGGSITEAYCGLDEEDNDFLQLFILTDGGNNNSSDGYWRILSGDVNFSGHLSATDLVYIEKCYEEHDCRFPAYRFLPVTEYDRLQDLYTQGGGGNYLYSYDNFLVIQEGTGDVVKQDFYGIKLGDPEDQNCTETQYRIGNQAVIFENSFMLEESHNIKHQFQNIMSQFPKIDLGNNVIENWFTLDGRLLFSNKYSGTSQNPYPSILENGMYIRSIECEGKAIAREKLIIIR
ncbi:MAG: hypothetical protein IPN29_15040 [Saprospiraceae bacterium]|nr:hypothetical protein [Saprospiraceae bacterium]